jgi:hypothetical protein
LVLLMRKASELPMYGGLLLVKFTGLLLVNVGKKNYTVFFFQQSTFM